MFCLKVFNHVLLREENGHEGNVEEILTFCRDGKVSFSLSIVNSVSYPWQAGIDFPAYGHGH